MPNNYFIDVNGAGFYFLKRRESNETVLPLGVDASRAVDAAREFVNQKGDGSTLDEGNAVPTYLNKIVSTKQHNGKTIGEVLRRDPGYLVWFFKTFDMQKNRKPENQELWLALNEMAKDQRSSFFKTLNESLDKHKQKQHVGRVGERVTVKVTVVSSFERPGQFDNGYLKVILHDDNGNDLWFASASKLAKTLHLAKSLSLPQSFLLTAEILEHGEYKGSAQTKIKPLDLSCVGAPEVGGLLSFDYSDHYSEESLKAKLQSINLLSHYFITRQEVTLILYPTTATRGEHQDKKNGAISYKKGFAYFRFVLNALLNRSELKDLIEVPLQMNIDGISLTKLELAPVVHPNDDH